VTAGFSRDNPTAKILVEFVRVCKARGYFLTQQSKIQSDTKLFHSDGRVL